METKVTFDTNGFSERIKSVSSQLQSQYTNYLKQLMQSEAKSSVDNTLDEALSEFKDSVNISTAGKQVTVKDLPDEVYKVLMQQYVTVEAPKVETIDGTLIKAMTAYVGDILADRSNVVTSADGEKYSVSFNFGATLGLATVTHGTTTYTVTWKSNKTQDSFKDLLANIKEYGDNFAVTFWTDLTSDVASDFIENVVKVLTNYSKEAADVVEKYLDLTEDVDAGDLSGEGVEAVTKFLGEKLFPQIFPKNNSAIQTAQKQYQTFLDSEAALLEDLNGDKNVKNLSSYKKFVTAFNNLEKTLSQSQTSFSTLLEEYTTYEFLDVTSGVFDQERVLINGNDDDNTINANGARVTMNGNGGDDVLAANGSYAVVSGGTGNDSIISAGNYSTLDGDEGDDVIIIEGNRSHADGGSGKDLIIVNASDVTVDGGKNFDGLPAPDTIRIETKAKNVVVENFESADTLDLSIYNADELSAGKNNFGLEIYLRKTNETLVTISDVSGGSNNNILCKDEHGSVTAVSLDWILENTPSIVNPYETLKADDKIISGTAGKDDSINNTLSGVTIDALAGNNSITNSGNNVTIYGGTGNDSIHNSGSNVTIDGKAGNDSVSNAGSFVSINGGEGNDIVRNYRSSVTIYGGTGDDSISNTSPSVTIDGGDDSDTIRNYEASVTIYGGNGNDSVYNGAPSVIIAGNDGDDTISNSHGKSVTIYGGNGEDLIRNSSSNVTIYGGADDDNVTNLGDSTTIDGGLDDDIIRNEGANVSIDGGDGSDTIRNGDSVGNGDSVTITGGNGNDYLTNRYGSNVIITGGNGDDSIRNWATNVSIDGGEGNDSIYNGNASVSITGGAGDDSILNGSTNVTIYGGVGNDTIRNLKDSVTINGGDGNDYIANYGSKTLFRYENGDGNDTIVGFGENSTLSISGGSYSSVATNNNDVIIRVGDGSITLENVKVQTLNITGTLATATTTPATSTTHTNSTTTPATSTTHTNSTTTPATSTTRNNSTTTPATSTTRNNSTTTPATSTTHTNSTTTPATSTTHTNSTTTTPVTSTTRNNSTTTPVTSTTRNNSTTTPVTSTTRNNSTTTPPATSTTRTNSTTTTNTQLVYTGGNQVIANYRSGEKITLGAFTGAGFDGAGNFVVSSPTGTLTVQNVPDKVVDLRDAAGNAFLKAYSATTAGIIDGRGIAGFEIINGSSGADYIVAGDGGSQLWGGNDTAADALVGGAGSDNFIGGKSQGNDFFANATAADIVSLTDVTLSDIVATAEIDGVIAIGFNSGNAVAIQSSEVLSAAVVLADGSSWRYNHATKNWQTA